MRLPFIWQYNKESECLQIICDLYVHAHCLYVGIHVCTYLYKPEFNLGHWSSEAITLLFDIGFSLAN